MDRTLLETLMKEPWMNSTTVPKFDLENATAWPKQFKCRFIEPGLVYYQDLDATFLVTKGVLDRMAQSYVGKPMVNRMHKDVSPADFRNGEADGIITKVWYNDADGWYWAEFLAWDATLQKDCENGKYSVSCAYVPTQIDEKGGVYHNIPYDGEIKEGEGTHIATVSNPRYEGAYITNSLEGGTDMSKWKFWKKAKNEKGEEILNASEIEGGASVEIGDKKVTVLELIECHNAANPEAIAEDSLVELANGKKVSVADLKKSYALANEKGDDDEDDKKKKKESKDEEERKNAEDKEKSEKDEKEKKEKENRNSAHSEGKHDGSAVKECELCNAAEKEHFEALKNAAANRSGGATPNLVTSREDMYENGAKKYGTAAK